jgi:hypothetical protein
MTRTRWGTASPSPLGALTKHFCDGVDYVTQDMMLDVLRDEERHRRLFEGFLREFERAPEPA